MNPNFAKTKMEKSSEFSTLGTSADFFVNLRRKKKYYVKRRRTVIIAILKFIKFTSSPKKTVGLHFSNLCLEGFHVGLIVPGFHIQDNVRLGNENRLWKKTLIRFETLFWILNEFDVSKTFKHTLWLFGIVSCKAFLSDFRSLLILALMIINIKCMA